MNYVLVVNQIRETHYGSTSCQHWHYGIILSERTAGLSHDGLHGHYETITLLHSLQNALRNLALTHYRICLTTCPDLVRATCIVLLRAAGLPRMR